MRLPAFPLAFVHRDDDSDEDDGNNNKGFRIFFNAFQCIGGLGLLLILIAALTRRIHRFMTWMNFCFAWIISSISYLLLFFLGRQADDEPSQGLCTTQAVLIYGAPVLCAFATFSLVLQLYFTVRANAQKGNKGNLGVAIWLVLTPYVIYAAVLGEATYFGLDNPDTVERNRSSVYCVINTGVPGTISSVLVACAILVTLAIEVVVARFLWVNWRVLRRVDERATVSSSLLVRIFVFTAFQIVALGSSFAFVLRSTDALPNGILALMPFVAFVVFGTQKDILTSFAFWRPFTRPRRPMSLRRSEIKSHVPLLGTD